MLCNDDTHRDLQTCRDTHSDRMCSCTVLPLCFSSLTRLSLMPTLLLSVLLIIGLSAQLCRMCNCLLFQIKQTTHFIQPFWFHTYLLALGSLFLKLYMGAFLFFCTLYSFCPSLLWFVLTFSGHSNIYSNAILLLSLPILSFIRITPGAINQKIIF